MVSCNRFLLPCALALPFKLKFVPSNINLPLELVLTAFAMFLDEPILSDAKPAISFGFLFRSFLRLFVVKSFSLNEAFDDLFSDASRFDLFVVNGIDSFVAVILMFKPVSDFFFSSDFLTTLTCFKNSSFICLSLKLKNLILNI